LSFCDKVLLQMGGEVLDGFIQLHSQGTFFKFGANFLCAPLNFDELVLYDRVHRRPGHLLEKLSRGLNDVSATIRKPVFPNRIPSNLLPRVCEPTINVFASGTGLIGNRIADFNRWIGVVNVVQEPLGRKGDVGYWRRSISWIF
jgi:hypothetical protein